MVGLAVLAGMGLGVSGVAATSQVSGDGAGPWSVQELTTDWSPGWTLPLAPVDADRRGRITWVSPLFLQTDRAQPAAVHAAAEPAAQATDAVDPAAETVAPAASDGGRGQSPIGDGRAPGASSNGNPRQANHGKANPGEPASGQSVAGRAQDQADGQVAAITPDAVQANAAETGAGAWEVDGMGTAKPGVKMGSTVEATVDSTVDSAVDSVSSWLGKFRR